MQHAQAFNQVELASAQTAAYLELENICLSVSDCQSQFLGLAPGIAKAGEAEIHRQHVGRAKFTCHGDGALPGAAACDQDILQHASRGTFKPGERKLAAEKISDRVRRFG